MLKGLLNACLIFCVIGLSPSAMATELVQQPEKSSRVFGIKPAAASAMCRVHCMPLIGFPASFGACYVACVAMALKQE